MCRWNLKLHLSWIQAHVSTTSLVSLCVSAPLQDVPRWKAAQDEPGLYHRWCETHLLVLWLQAVNTGRTAVYPFTKRSCHLAQNTETFDLANRCSEIVCWLCSYKQVFSPPEKEISKCSTVCNPHYSPFPSFCAMSEHFHNKLTFKIWPWTRIRMHWISLCVCKADGRVGYACWWAYKQIYDVLPNTQGCG